MTRGDLGRQRDRIVSANKCWSLRGICLRIKHPHSATQNRKYSTFVRHPIEAPAQISPAATPSGLRLRTASSAQDDARGIPSRLRLNSLANLIRDETRGDCTKSVILSLSKPKVLAPQGDRTKSVILSEVEARRATGACGGRISDDNATVL